MKISRSETMSGKIRHLENICEKISLRNRGKVFPYKKCERKEGRTQPLIKKNPRSIKNNKTSQPGAGDQINK